MVQQLTLQARTTTEYYMDSILHVSGQSWGHAQQVWTNMSRSKSRTNQNLPESSFQQSEQSQSSTDTSAPTSNSPFGSFPPQSHHHIPPWLQAAGDVGAASLGALTIVGETAVNATRRVWATTAETCATVVERKYQSKRAGQSIRETSQIVENIYLTVQTSTKLISPHTWTTVIAKQRCKQHVREHQQYYPNTSIATQQLGGG
jgi:hypothetical protein